VRIPCQSNNPVSPGLSSARDEHSVTDDAELDERFSPARGAAPTEAGFHSLVLVPLMRGRQVIGALNVGRAEIRPYPTGEIQLLQTFANQAVRCAQANEG
jgi:GAF domain-containing protein